MKVLRGRQSGVDLKPPQAAVVKSSGGERCGKAGTGFRQAWLGEANASEPLQQTVSLFDHFVRGYLQGERHFEAERICGLEVDYQLEPNRLHDWEFGRFRAL